MSMMVVLNKSNSNKIEFKEREREMENNKSTG